MSIITNYVFVFMLQIFSTQPQATIVLGRFLVTLLLASSLPLPQLVIQDLVLTVILLILFIFFLFSPQRKKGAARPHHLLLLLRICIRQIHVPLYLSRLANINTSSILKVVILRGLIYNCAVLYTVLQNLPDFSIYDFLSWCQCFDLLEVR